MTFVIIRPPLSDQISLPSRQTLLSLREGDQVSLILDHPENGTTRRWVTIKSPISSCEWTGRLSDDLSSPLIHFHPYDVMDIKRLDQDQWVKIYREKSFPAFPDKEA